MPRIMADAATPGNIPPIKKQLVAGYKTGTPGQAWAGHWADFPGVTMVTIDQHGGGQVDHSCMVMDVEPQCYAASDVPDWTRACEWERPTVYCDRSEYPAVRAVWKGDIILAAPSLHYPSLAALQVAWPGVIAIQDTFAGSYDLSTIYDDAWPFRTPPPVPVPASVTATVTGRLVSLAYPAISGADHYVIMYEHTDGSGLEVLKRAVTATVTGLEVPGASGGKISVYAIVHARAIGPVTVTL